MRKKVPKTIKVRLKLTKRDIRKITRVSRWEKESENTCIVLGPRA